MIQKSFFFSSTWGSSCSYLIHSHPPSSTPSEFQGEKKRSYIKDTPHPLVIQIIEQQRFFFFRGSWPYPAFCEVCAPSYKRSRQRGLRHTTHSQCTAALSSCEIRGHRDFTATGKRGARNSSFGIKSLKKGRQRIRTQINALTHFHADLLNLPVSSPIMAL